ASGPTPPIWRAQEQCLHWGMVFVNRAAQILQIESSIPVGQHGGVVVGPTVVFGQLGVSAIGAEGLKAFGADCRAQPSVMVGKPLLLPHVTDGFFGPAGSKGGNSWGCFP